jgi:hypothetical protein
MTIKLGDKAKDRVSGFAGIVTASYHYLNGCVRMHIDPDCLDKDGKHQEGKAFDIEQLELVTPDVIAKMAPTGGPMDAPAPRSTPRR